MGYWGYPWANGSAYGNPWGGVGYGYPTSIGAPAYGASYGASSPDAGQGTDAGTQSQKTGGIKGFFKGIAQGAVNTIKGIFTPQGLLMAGGTAALAIMTGGAILPLLGAVGIGIGGYQVLKGATTGDTEKMGEGVFSLGLSSLGFLGGKSVNIKAANGTKVSYRLMPSKAGGKVGILDRFRALIGRGKYEAHTGTKGAYTKLTDGELYAAHGKPLNLYELSWMKMKNRFEGMQTSWKNRKATRGEGGSVTPSTGPLRPSSSHSDLPSSRPLRVRRHGSDSSSGSGSDSGSLSGSSGLTRSQPLRVRRHGSDSSSGSGSDGGHLGGHSGLPRSRPLQARRHSSDSLSGYRSDSEASISGSELPSSQPLQTRRRLDVVSRDSE